MLKLILTGGIKDKFWVKRSIDCDPITDCTEAEGEFGLGIGVLITSW